MKTREKLYIAGTGMISSVGGDVAMTSAAVNAGISGYGISEFNGVNNESVTMTRVPDSFFSTIDVEIKKSRRFNKRHDRVTKMAIVAIREACALHTTAQSVPLLLAMPEEQVDEEGLSPLINNLEHNCTPWISNKLCRSFFSGRAAGMDGIDFAFRYLSDHPDKFILVGGSDSYLDYSRIDPLAQDDRLLSESNMDGFAPGEAASFLLLTPHPDIAMQRNGHIVALNYPGVANEVGHLHSEVPYRGEGLAQAFKQALNKQTQPKIHSIYSSMNGESHWAKEYGVAFIRNKQDFLDTVTTEHPADILGDIGSATSSMLIALAAEDLYRNDSARAHLVYSSSDAARRGAIVLEKVVVTETHS